MYESKPLRDQEVRQSLSQMSLEERKIKKAIHKNSARKQIASAAATEGASWQQPGEQAPKIGRVATTQLSGLETQVQPQPLVGPRPMKKYTGNEEALLSRNPTELVSKIFILPCVF